jgi:nucleoid DNA-binding protein
MDAAVIERLVRFLLACRHDEWLYLPGTGWLTAKHYHPYEGPNPRTGERMKAPGKFLPHFNADPELYRALDGLPPSDTSFPDEFARYFHALHPDLDGPSADPTLEESFTVARFPWAEEISEEIGRAIVAGGRAELPGFGTFILVEKPGRSGVNPDTGERIQIPPRRLLRFNASDELKHRLSEKNEGSVSMR